MSAAGVGAGHVRPGTSDPAGVGAGPVRPGSNDPEGVEAGSRPARAVVLKGEAREVALAEAQAVLTMVQDEGRRDKLAGLVAAASEGEVAGPDADALEELLALGLQSGRLRALYGPGGEQAALQTYRRLPAGAALAASAREVSAALGSLVGSTLDSVSVQAVGPGAFTVSISAGGRELTVKLDRQGARLASVGI